MRRTTRVRLTLFLALTVWAMVIPTAQAYIDPGSTTVVFQAIVAGIAAAGTGVAMFWSRIKSFFTRGGSDEATDANESTEKV